MPLELVEAPTSVSVIVPCRNEELFAGQFVRSLESQDLEGLDWEVIIADGMSTDGTIAELTKVLSGNRRFRIIDNPEGIVSTGLNAAIRVARGDVIVRMDMHTQYHTDYVKSCLSALRETGASNVGGPWVARGKGYIGSAIAVAFQSPFSCGGGQSHDPDYEGPVDTVYLGCWRRDIFTAVGLFDKDLVRNQDDEHNSRLQRAGRVIYQTPRIRSWYTPRSSLFNLFRQYSQYGYWKTFSILKHRKVVSLRHLVPASFLMANLVLLLLLLFVRLIGRTHAPAPVLVPLVLLNALYLLAVGWISIVLAAQKGLRLLPILPVVFATYHFGYGFGFLAGLLQWAIGGHANSIRFSQLSR